MRSGVAGMSIEGTPAGRRASSTAAITVWGARTIGGDANADLKYVSTRRLLLYLKKSIDQGTQWVVFEPNDPSLWANQLGKS